jgi:hypothetical protein
LIFDRYELFKEEMGKRKIPQNNDLVFAAMIAHALYQLVDKLDSIRPISRFHVVALVNTEAL